MNLEITNRYVYVVSDIHNDASGFKELLNKIAFSKDDLLIINGDILTAETNL
ncbi:metallophosphoesterase [Ligilactobacillus ruminis]|uniref:metallophosphoesterase n=1 Tax=Ligilactobacillus ruminis TaxID=1623 RepID=UPI003F98720D